MKFIIYIGAALVIGLLIGFVALSIVWLRKTMLQNVRNHTLDLLSVYDEVLEEKSREISRADEILKAGEAAQEEEPPKEAPASGSETGVSPQTLLAVAERAAEASYRDASTGELYHQIKQNFAFQLDELLPVVAAMAKAAGGPAARLLEELNFETVYQLSTLTEQEQIMVLTESLSEEGVTLMNEYRVTHPQFAVFGFYDFLKSRAVEESGAVRVFVPAGTTARTHPHNSATVSVDREICEGFQVEMDGKLYDYCIKAKELS